MPPSDLPIAPPGSGVGLPVLLCLLGVVAIALFLALRRPAPAMILETTIEEHSCNNKRIAPTEYNDPEASPPVEEVKEGSLTSCFEGSTLPAPPPIGQRLQDHLGSSGAPADSRHISSPPSQSVRSVRPFCELCGKGPFTAPKQAAEHEASKLHQKMLRQKAQLERRVENAPSPVGKHALPARNNLPETGGIKPRLATCRVANGPREGADCNFASRRALQVRVS